MDGLDCLTFTCAGYERQTWAVCELLIISGGLEEKQKESDRNLFFFTLR